ncbi:DUF2306 domain-containing protein [Ruegeria sp. HKCCD4884]|uniref:DUF2306 domain-containing protein n=1 Tax=Ruegeria sp. HKCCD4884 TaxID=2683022 RepID=UPI0020A5E88B|nr:DUF2306 domain-containing protein [Ruegeria sp. HKCCD4884]
MAAGSQPSRKVTLKMHVLTRGEWAFLVAIFVYSFIPSVVGLLRIPELLGGPMLMPSNPRAVTEPVPIILHILGSAVFCLLGALQFLPSLRKMRPHLHRRLGWFVAVGGGISALTGLWMTIGYAFPQAPQGPLLFSARIVFSLGMLGFIVWAVFAIRFRNVCRHRAAMLRAYAIGQGASTQTALFLLVMAFFGTEPLGFARDVLMVAAWVINIAAAEILIRRVFVPRGAISKAM